MVRCPGKQFSKLRKLNTELPKDPGILLGMHPKELQTGVQTNTWTRKFTGALIYSRQKVETNLHPWGGAGCGVCTQWNVQGGKELLMPTTAYTNLENTMLGEGSQMQKTTQRMIPLIPNVRKRQRSGQKVR